MFVVVNGSRFYECTVEATTYVLNVQSTAGAVQFPENCET